MINITLDLGNIPSVLAALASQATQNAVVYAAAESYADDTLDWIQQGRAFTTRTGQLGQSIGWRPHGPGAAEVYANAEYAPFVELGTGPHMIRPRNRRALRFPVGGGAGFVFAREINHPGSRPHPFFFADQSGRSARMTDRALSVLAGRMEG